MLIFNKIINGAQGSIFYNFENYTCSEVKKALQKFSSNKVLVGCDYKYLLSEALDYCKKNLPSPENMEYPNCVSLTVGINFFTLKLNPNFGFGVKILTSKDGNTRYELSLVFEKDLAFAKNMPFYKELEDNEWQVKEINSHKKVFNKRTTAD